jgi:hypothetical protein
MQQEQDGRLDKSQERLDNHEGSLIQFKKEMHYQMRIFWALSIP